MTQYINKGALVAEIDRLCEEHTSIAYRDDVALVLEDLEEFLGTLEVKEVDLEKEIEKCLKQHNMLAVGKKDFTDIDKHFYELGLKAAQNEHKSCTTNE